MPALFLDHQDPLTEAQPLPSCPTSILYYLPAVSNKGSSTFAAIWGFLWLWFALWLHENAQRCLGWVLVGLEYQFTHYMQTNPRGI